MSNNFNNLKEMDMSLINALIKQKSTQQNIVEKLGVDVNVDRCMIFRIFSDDDDVRMCEIIAGIPTDEGEHGIGLKEPIDRHKDLTEVMDRKNILHIKNPQKSKYTDFGEFRDIITKKNVSEILYIPLFIGSKKESVGIVVIDMINPRRFTEKEADHCREAGDRISSTFEHIEMINQQWRDKFVSPIVTMKAFIRHLYEEVEDLEKLVINNMGKSKKKLQYIEEALTQLESQIPKTGEIFDKLKSKEG